MKFMERRRLAAERTTWRYIAFQAVIAIVFALNLLNSNIKPWFYYFVIGLSIAWWLYIIGLVLSKTLRK